MPELVKSGPDLSFRTEICHAERSEESRFSMAYSAFLAALEMTSLHSCNITAFVGN